MRTVVRVFSGEYDLAHESNLRMEFDTARNEPNLILDMRGVSYVDSTFANELLRLHKYRVVKGIGAVSIVRSAFIVKRLFSILYFKTLFQLFDTLEEALPTNGSAVVVQGAFIGDTSPFPGLPLSIHTTKMGKALPVWDSLVAAPTGLGGPGVQVTP